MAVKMAATQTVLLVAGEASGDDHGASLVAAVQQRHPELKFFGMGGSKLRALGMDTVVDSERSASLMGVSELRGSLSTVVDSYKRLLTEVEARKPTTAVLIDYAEFNMRLAQTLHARGVKVLYFIPPQMWAWRQGRVKKIRRFVDRVAAIFPFEESFYARHKVRAQFVGHPFCYKEPVAPREQYLPQIGLDPTLPVLALLPGSRHSELTRLLVPMLDATALIRRGRPGLQVVIPVAASLDFDEVKQLAAPYAGVTVVKGSAREILSSADAAVVASGTATVEAALTGVPFVAVYRLAPFTFLLAKLLVRGVNNFAMVNLVAGRRLVTELLQDQVSGERIAVEVERFLGDPVVSKKMRDQLLALRERLIGPKDGRTPGQRVAGMLLELSGIASDEGAFDRSGWRQQAKS